METTFCPSCQLPLEITPDMAGQEMACPRCNAHFVIAGGASASPPHVQPPTADFQPVSQVRDRGPRRPSQDQATSLLDLFDLSFTRYVTPLIVKITWVLALTLSAIWLLMVVIGLIISAMPEIEIPATSPAERTERPRVQYEFRAPPLVERAGEASFSHALRIVIVITQVVGIVLFLLWLRVALEAVIVIFHMAASLKSIDDKTRRGPS